MPKVKVALRSRRHSPIEVESCLYIDGRGERRVVSMDTYALAPREAETLARALLKMAARVRREMAAPRSR